MDRTQLEQEYLKLLDLVLDGINTKLASGEISEADAEELRAMTVNSGTMVLNNSKEPVQYTWEQSEYWESSSTIC